ncbi:MAG: L,D-transpeptidase [candidate division WOR-3 bacterium]|nr:MAG: L,D-transpeptidase [candidate division WOR-3 bacterium]
MRKIFSFKKLQKHFGFQPDHGVIVVSVSQQRLYLIKRKEIIKNYPVSTSRYGIGNRDGSYKTPLGVHRISSRIGKDAHIGEIFQSRKRTHRIARISAATTGKEEDVITTRILRLEGREPGINKGKGIDSYERCIYIHGTAAEHLIGKPASHGCIRMRNKDIVELFDLVKRGTLVEIRK